jgi:hypothetical protein
MAKDDRAKDDASPKPRRRGKPPVLELAATEIGANEGADPRKPEAADPQPEPGAAQPWFSARSPALIAALIGVVLVGAAIAVAAVRGLDGGDARLSKLSADIAALSARVEAIAGRPANTAAITTLGERVDRLAGALTEAERRLAAIENKPAPQMSDLAPLAARTGALEAAVENVRKDVSERLRALEERITNLAAASRSATSPALAAEIVALGMLRDALDSGMPFKAELAAVRALLGARAAALAALDPVAEAGLPTRAVLARRFSVLAPVLRRESAPQGGFFDRLMQSASRLIEVRRVGEEPAGDELPAVVARMEARLQRGDLSGAFDEAAKAPALTTGAAGEWLKVARLRRDADLALKNLIASSLAALAAERAQ